MRAESEELQGYAVGLFFLCNNGFSRGLPQMTWIVAEEGLPRNTRTRRKEKIERSRHGLWQEYTVGVTRIIDPSTNIE